MSHSYSSLFCHIVWATKNRTPYFSGSTQKRVHSYLEAVIKNEKAEPIAIGGMPEEHHKNWSFEDELKFFSQF